MSNLSPHPGPGGRYRGRGLRYGEIGFDAYHSLPDEQSWLVQRKWTDKAAVYKRVGKAYVNYYHLLSLLLLSHAFTRAFQYIVKGLPLKLDRGSGSLLLAYQRGMVTVAGSSMHVVWIYDISAINAQLRDSGRDE